MKKDIKYRMLISVLFFTFSLMFVFLFIISINYYNVSKTTYNDLMYGEFTVESIREIVDPDMGNIYYIDVAEEEKNIKVNNILANKKIRDGVLSLKSGDMIRCYFISNSSYYEIVELKAENRTILSLDDYNKIYNRQGTIGIIISPILFVIMFGIAVKALWSIRKARIAV